MKQSIQIDRPKLPWEPIYVHMRYEHFATQLALGRSPQRNTLAVCRYYTNALLGIHPLNVASDKTNQNSGCFFLVEDANKSIKTKQLKHRPVQGE